MPNVALSAKKLHYVKIHHLLSFTTNCGFNPLKTPTSIFPILATVITAKQISLKPRKIDNSVTYNSANFSY
jgi:hypothetical protein